MQKWEYLVGTMDIETFKDKVAAGGQVFENIDVMLNHLGEQGWELISSSMYTIVGTTKNISYYFKRQKSE